MSNKKVGFIGAGYMGYGMAKNLIKDFDVYVIAHKNRKPIDKLIKDGATEVFTYEEKSNAVNYIFQEAVKRLTPNNTDIDEY